MNVDAMPAGPELDALVAEKVFGLKGVGYYGPTKAHGTHQDYQVMSREDAYKAYVDLWNEGVRPEDSEDIDLCSWKENWGPLIVPEYSTDIAAAWEVVEKIKDINPDKHMDSKPFFEITWVHDTKVWSVAWEHPNPYERETVYTGAIGETLPIAICRAALKAANQVDITK